ncbi:uncharacterized protein LOC111039695 [Myzus persicae]|uniref:uncharacterized protein LOC111039695 n=1 Tax=Myzus persicae TaxID=13164 RepID=UPI000B9387B0|nr:uncharacterized protein LOC111039695 [Myzus persicae]
MTVFGNWEELDVEMFDFKRKPIEEDTTVIELYEKTGLPKLRYYLATRRKNGIRSFIQNTKNYTEVSMEHVNLLTPDPPKNSTLEFSIANDSIIKGDLLFLPIYYLI